MLAATDRTRVPELVPVRYERMLTSPFASLRGAAAIMAEASVLDAIEVSRKPAPMPRLELMNIRLELPNMATRDVWCRLTGAGCGPGAR